MNVTHRHLAPPLAGAIAAAVVPAVTALASAPAPRPPPAQAVAAPRNAPGQTATLAGLASSDCRQCLDCNEQPLVLVTAMFTVVALIGIVAWTAAFWKLLGLLKTQLPPTPRRQHDATAETAPSEGQGEEGRDPHHAESEAAPGDPDLATSGPPRPSLREASADDVDATTMAATGPSTLAANRLAPASPTTGAGAEQPAAAAVDRDFYRFLPDFLSHPEYQSVLASLCRDEPGASRDRELLAGHLAVLNAAVQASDRRHYHDAMLETALRGIGTCLATLSREQQPPGDKAGCDLLAWEKQLQALLSKTTAYGLRTPMTGDKVDNDWMSAPPRTITVSVVDCWAIYKRNDIVCKALVR